MDIALALLFGLVATGAMSLLLRALQPPLAAQGVPVWGIGSAVPEPAGVGSAPGAVVYIVAGLLAGLAYRYAGVALGWPVPGLLGLAVVTGLLRGVAVSLVLTGLAAGQDPWANVRAAGPTAMTWHTVGHVVYGVALWLLFGLAGVPAALGFWAV